MYAVICVKIYVENPPIILIVMPVWDFDTIKFIKDEMVKVSLH